jgi:hypothetical protein
MNQYSGAFTTPEVNGDFNGWCGNCNAMSDPDGDNIWTVTLPLTQDSIEYKFAHDSWTGQENLTEGSACTKTSSGFTNRFIYINGDTTLPAVCWESCMECVPPPDTSNVTFQIDMNGYSGSFTTPEVNGTFNGWCGNCNAMSDPDGDNIWEVTLPLTDASIEYKFSHDSWTGQEELTEGSFCTVTNGGFTNRYLVLTGDTVLPPVCWAYCITCDEIPDTSMVTFQVDMRGYTGSYTTPEVNGLFNGWCGNCNAMEDPDNDSIWTTTIALTADSTEYKFSHDNWTGQEELTEGSACTKTTSGFTNRFIYINGDTLLPAVCWASCDECESDDPGNDTSTVVNEINEASLQIFPNPAKEELWVKSDDNISAVNLYTLAGVLVQTINNVQETSVSLNLTDVPNGVYLIEVANDSATKIERIIVAK